MKTVAFAVFPLAAMSSACGAEQALTCPDTLSSANIRLLAPRGWVGVAPASLPLMSAFVILGPPGERGVLKGERFDLGKNKRFEVRFEELAAGPKLEKWFACSYGDTDLQIARQLDPTTTRCVATFRPDGQGAFRVTAACR